MNIPGTARQGDTWEWNERSQIDPQGNVLTPPTYTLYYQLVGAVKLLLTGTVGANSGSGWTFTATPAQTSTLTPGRYFWQMYATSAAGDRFTLGNGTVDVSPDLTAQAAGAENRSPAKIAIDAIDAEIAARLTGGTVIEYSVAGRTLRKEPMQALLALKGHYAAIYSAEVRRSRIRQGLGDPKSRAVIFRPPGGFFGFR